MQWLLYYLNLTKSDITFFLNLNNVPVVYSLTKFISEKNFS